MTSKPTPDFDSYSKYVKPSAWIRHDGGDKPAEVDDNDVVKVRYRGRVEFKKEDIAHKFHWPRTGGRGDIYSYKIIRERKNKDES